MGVIEVYAEKKMLKGAENYFIDAIFYQEE